MSELELFFWFFIPPMVIAAVIAPVLTYLRWDIS